VYFVNYGQIDQVNEIFYVRIKNRNHLFQLCIYIFCALIVIKIFSKKLISFEITFFIMKILVGSMLLDFLANFQLLVRKLQLIKLLLGPVLWSLLTAYTS